MATTRKQALQQGDKTYFTGKACMHGHVAARLAASGACVLCNRNRNNKGRVYGPGLHVAVCLEDPNDRAALDGFVALLNEAARARVSQQIAMTRKMIAGED